MIPPFLEELGKEKDVIISSMRFWLMYDFKFKTNEAEIMIKNLKEENYSKGFIDEFKKRAISTIPGEFYKKYNIESVVIR